MGQSCPVVRCQLQFCQHLLWLSRALKQSPACRKLLRQSCRVVAWLGRAWPKIATEPQTWWFCGAWTWWHDAMMTLGAKLHQRVAGLWKRVDRKRTARQPSSAEASKNISTAVTSADHPRFHGYGLCQGTKHVWLATFIGAQMDWDAGNVLLVFRLSLTFLNLKALDAGRHLHPEQPRLAGQCEHRCAQMPM